MPKIEIKPVFERGQIVYLVADPEQYPRIVTGYYLGGGGLLYEIRFSDEDHSMHGLVEISAEPKEKEVE